MGPHVSLATFKNTGTAGIPSGPGGGLVWVVLCANWMVLGWFGDIPISGNGIFSSGYPDSGYLVVITTNITVSVHHDRYTPKIRILMGAATIIRAVDDYRRKGSLLSWKSTKDGVAIGLPKSDVYTVPIGNYFTQSYLHARGEIIDIPSNISKIPMLSKLNPRPQTI